MYLAQAIMRLHGSVLVTREKHGLHLNFACPSCLETEGSVELRKKHFALNADKHLLLGQWADEDLHPGVRDKVGMCMKNGCRFGVKQLLEWPSLDKRGIKQSKAGKVSFADNTAWLVEDAQGNQIPGGPGDGTEGSLIPVNALPNDHPASVYLQSRDYNLNALWEQFRCSYCEREWPASPAANRYYRKMPDGFQDSPQGRIVFFADIGGVQRSWQARIIEAEFSEGGQRYKAFWNGQTRRWHTMERFNESIDKFEVLPQFANGMTTWSPSKYRTANGAIRNEILFGLDAAVKWNKQHRRNQLPLAFSLEGPLDAGRFGPPALAKTGKYTSDDQIALMKKYFSIVVEVPDNDKAGRQNLQDTWSRMEQQVTTHVWELPEHMSCVPHRIKDAGLLPQKVADVMKQAYMATL